MQEVLNFTVELEDHWGQKQEIVIKMCNIEVYRGPADARGYVDDGEDLRWEAAEIFKKLFNGTRSH